MQRNSFELGIDDDVTQTVEFSLCGRFGDQFIDFVVHRAAKLSLNGWVSVASDTVSAVVQGPSALVDAFEMACSLGPRDSVVAAVNRRNYASHAQLSDFVVKPMFSERATKA